MIFMIPSQIKFILPIFSERFFLFSFSFLFFKYQILAEAVESRFLDIYLVFSFFISFVNQFNEYMNTPSSMNTLLKLAQDNCEQNLWVSNRLLKTKQCVGYESYYFSYSNLLFYALLFLILRVVPCRPRGCFASWLPEGSADRTLAGGWKEKCDASSCWPPVFLTVTSAMVLRGQFQKHLVSVLSFSSIFPHSSLFIQMSMPAVAQLHKDPPLSTCIIRLEHPQNCRVLPQNSGSQLFRAILQISFF